jgi:APA family basic amino acid/polyamine antiporter
VSSSVQRRLGTPDAVVLGLAAMLGTGVFAVWAPAAAAAGTWLPLAVLLAGVVALCNAVSTADLAAAYPESGAGYVYGRHRLGPAAGRLAGVAFLTGKSASAAAAAGVFGSYVLPAQPLPTAIAAVVAATALNVAGVRWTARAAYALVGGTVAVLLVVVAVGLFGSGGTEVASAATAESAPVAVRGGLLGVGTAAGLVFFAFAGYARIATLGEEVRDPETTIPRAIPRALGIVVVLYAVVGVALLAILGPAGVAASDLPLLAAADQAGVSWMGALVRVAAVLASLGALLGLVTGVSRTMLAMARERDLPAVLARVDERRGVPQAAQAAVCAVVVLLVVAFDVRAVIGFSSFGVLVYYAVANAAAVTQDPAHRRWPRGLHVLGIVGCVVLVVTLPWAAVAVGVCVFAVGVLGRLAAQRIRTP